MEIIILPEIQSMLFPLREEELKALEESILKEGIRDPLIVWPKDGKYILVDGHHRYEIAQKYGLEFKVMEKDFKDLEEVLAWIDLNQLGRRNLTDEQRSLIVGRIYERSKKDKNLNLLYSGYKSKSSGDEVEVVSKGQNVPSMESENSVDSTEKVDHATARELASKVGLSEKSVRRAADFAKAIASVEKISPTVAQSILKGEIKDAIVALPNIVKNSLDILPDIVKTIESGKTNSIKEAKSLVSREYATKEIIQQKEVDGERSIVYRMDALDFLHSLGDSTVDLLLTDPPYMTNVSDIYSFAKEWVPLALSKVKSSGRIYIFTGSYPEELHAYLTVLLENKKDFIFTDVLVWTYRNTLGPKPTYSYKRNWQAIFYLYGPDAKLLNAPLLTEQFMVQDVSAPDARVYERLGAYQKPDELAERLIRHSTEPGDIVVDPFAGTGTFLVTAMKLGRRGIGSEIDEEMLKICEERGIDIGNGF